MDFLNHHKKAERQRNTLFVGKRWLPLWVLLFAVIAPLRSFSQNINPLISFTIESCTLDQALEKLFAEYELNIAFSKAEMSKIRIEGYSCSYKSVEEVLADLLKGTDYGFKKVGKQYVVRKNQHIAPPVSANDPPADPPAPPVVVAETVEHKTDTVVERTTIRIADTVRIIRSVVRHDTVIRIEQVEKIDTVYAVKYKGLAIDWPSFKDNGWFITPSVAYGFAKFRLDQGEETVSATIDPSSDFTVGIDAGNKANRVSVGMSLTYRSLRYRFGIDQVVHQGDCYVNDTLDSYYVVHPSASDTVWHYIVDSTYIPLTTTHYSHRDINRLDYLGVGVFATYDFWKKEHFRMFANAGVSVELLLSQAGTTVIPDAPFHAEITRDSVKPARFSYHLGLGAAFKVADRIELVPEVRYHSTVGPLYAESFPLGLTTHSWVARLGLTYYF